MARRRVHKLSLAAFVVLTVVWIGSGWGGVWYVTGTTGVGIAEGAVIGEQAVRMQPASFGYRVGPWHVEVLPEFSRIPNYRLVIIPLWPAALLAGIATVVFGYRSRPIPSGHCTACRYDLTGNVSGVCPECGNGTGDG